MALHLAGAAPRAAVLLPALLADCQLTCLASSPTPTPNNPMQGMVGAWEATCGPLDQYAMRHSRAFANLCNAGLQPPMLGAVAAERCGSATAATAPVQLVGPDAHVAAA